MEKIPFHKSTWFPPLFNEYTSLNEKLEPLYAFKPTIEGVQGAISQREFTEENRAVLVNTLLEQYKAVKDFAGSLVEANVLKLKEKNTFTITTGQQLHPFLGPEMVFNKIEAAIDISKGLMAKGEQSIIPVFWMASEDHDFEEVKTITFFGKEFIWEKEQDGAVGRMPTKNLVKVIEDMILTFSHDEKVVYLLKEYKEVYSRHSSYANATREVAHRIFGNKGLVVIDGDHAALKELFAPIIEKEIKANFAFSALKVTNGLIKELGFRPILNPMKENFFHLKDGLREKVNHNAMDLNKLNSFNVSPNVVLRPVYQEVILPNVAYIAGPSELSYWLQLKEVFKGLNVFYPAVLPRLFTLNIKKKDLAYLKSINIELDTLFFTMENLNIYFLKRESEKLVGLLQEIELIKDKISDESSKLGAVFYKSIKNTLKDLSKNVKSIQNELLNAPIQEDKINKLLRIKRGYFDFPIERKRFGIEGEVNGNSSFQWGGSYFGSNCHKNILIVEK